MDLLEKQKNIGWVEFDQNKNEPTDRKVVVILGQPRGGTSLISGILHHLGVYIGENLNRGTFEDSKIKHAISKFKSNPEIFLSLRDLLDSKYENWAFKITAAFRDNNSDAIIQTLKDPIFIIIIKDIASIAIRRQSMSKRHERGILHLLTNAHNTYGSILGLIEQHSGKKLLMSYEKILDSPDEAVNAIAEFVGVHERELIQRATSVVQRNRPEYLDLSRIDKIYGVVWPIKNSIVKGWAAYSKVTLGNPSIGIYISNELVGKGVADRYISADLKLKEMAPETQRDPGIRTCYSRAMKFFDHKIGFSIKLPEEVNVLEGVHARSIHNGEELSGSPVFLPSQLSNKRG